VLAGQPERIAWETLTADEWRTLTQAAARHGVAPLLWHHAQQGTWAAQMPAAARQDLRRAYYTTTAQNTMLYHELGRILAALEGIPVVVLKGAALAATLYPQIGLRPMGDIDVLVGVDHIETATQRVTTAGYRLAVAPHDNAEFEHENGQTKLEISWIINYGQTQMRPALTRWFWDNTAEQTITLPDGTTSTFLYLNATAHLLYAALHLHKHLYDGAARLLWWYDMHALLAQQQHSIDWEMLQQIASTFHLHSKLSLILAQVQGYFGSTIPIQVASSAGISVDTQADTRFGRVMNSLAYLPWRYRLNALRMLIFPDSLFIQRRYNPRPRWLWPVYYLYRWFDLGLDTATYAICRLSQRKHTP
jgi:hypothetical protein